MPKRNPDGSLVYGGRFNGTPRCRICGTTEQISRHHLVPKHFVEDGHKFGLTRRVRHEDVGHRCNIVRLCVPCHMAVEQGRLRWDLRSALGPNELRHVERVAGRYWLDRAYPRAQPDPS